MADKRYVFLSYGRRDVYPQGVTNPVEQEQHFPLVEKIYHHLNGLKDTLGLEPWFDKRCLTHDRPFTDSINYAVEQSDYLLLFIGAHSMASEWCEREWKHALRHCVPIIPILLEGQWSDPTVQKTYGSRLLSTDGINPLRPDATIDENHLLTRIVDIVRQTPAPLTVPINARTLPDHYIERPQYINDLKKRLGVNDINYRAQSNIVAITSKQESAALQGVGGIGKTTLASALCADCDVRRAFDHIFWLEAGPDVKAEAAPGLMRVRHAFRRQSRTLQ
ncbi:MAG: toll/interleukin-1 receptor domain-containing protein [Anaerolineae bacterium]